MAADETEPGRSRKIQSSAAPSLEAISAGDAPNKGRHFELGPPLPSTRQRPAGASTRGADYT